MSVIIDGTTGIETPAVTTDSYVVDTLTSTTGVVNGITVGKGGGAVTSNTAVGSGTLANAGNTGGLLSAVGQYAMGVNTTGVHNDAFGAYSLYSNTTGNYNDAYGVASLQSNTTGSSNVAIGKSALQSNTTASNNTAVGYQAGYSNTTGANVTAFGYQAGYSHTTGNYNVFIGGRGCGYSATTGEQNTFVGDYAGRNVTTGGQNTLIGQGAGYQITTGSKNTVLGVFTGNNGGLDIRTASNYIVLSDGDGNPRQIIDGSGQALFGTSNAASGAGNGVKIYPIGKIAVVQPDGFDNYNMYNTTAGAYRFYITQAGQLYATSTTISAISDQRLKENIRDLDLGLDAIMAVKPRRFDWKEGKGQDKKNAVGFIAQEFEQVFPDSVTNSKAGEDGIEYKTVRHEELIPALVKAIQELKAEVDSLKQQLGK